jgi:hypothetical protein
MMQGKLTYALAAAAIVWAAFGYLSGFIDAMTALNVAWSGLTAFGIRRAVANNGLQK